MQEIKLDGGHLSLTELNALFHTIPQEFDVLDANDIIVWSSMNRHRIFKRTKADIGKTVYQVHPGHSQKAVHHVLQQMHKGKRQGLSITITKDKTPINISFYRLTSQTGKYLGCVEVTQPIRDYQLRGHRWRNFWHLFR